MPLAKKNHNEYTTGYPAGPDARVWIVGKTKQTMSFRHDTRAPRGGCRILLYGHGHACARHNLPYRKCPHAPLGSEVAHATVRPHD